MMSTTTEYVYTEADERVFNEGRKARLEGRDYFSCEYMRTEVRDLYALCAWSEGYLSVDTPSVSADVNATQE